MRGCHLCIISAFKMPNTATPYCFTHKAAKDLRSCLTDVSYYLSRLDWSLETSCIYRDVLVCRDNCSGFWLKYEVRLRVHKPIATYHYAYNSDMPQTTSTLIAFYMTTILLSWVEVLLNRAQIYSCDGRNEALHHSMAMPWKSVL